MIAIHCDEIYQFDEYMYKKMFEKKANADLFGWGLSWSNGITVTE